VVQAWRELGIREPEQERDNRPTSSAKRRRTRKTNVVASNNVDDVIDAPADTFMYSVNESAANSLELLLDASEMIHREPSVDELQHVQSLLDMRHRP
jgi:hypothetical protein